MNYGDELVRVTIGSYDYAAFESTQTDGVFDIHRTTDNKCWSYFGWFNDPEYLKKENFEELIRYALVIFTGI